MYDSHNRPINYLRVSVTDRCNFSCIYCVPRQGKKWLDHSEILTYEELLRLIKLFSREGITSIRLTGGEPLVRKGIIDFISSITALGVIKDLSMTTNGSLLAPVAKELKAAGLRRVNISLDTVNPASFSRVTSCGRLEDTMSGIESSFVAGLEPVKINVVLTDVLCEKDLAFFTEMIIRYPIAVRFIEYMPIGNCEVASGPDIATIRRLLEKLGHAKLKPTSIRGNGPAKYYQFPGSKGVFGFITPITNHYCGACNRLRLTADGKLRPCLLSNKEIDLRDALRNGAPDRILTQLYREAAREKPQGHSLCRTSGYPAFERTMTQIGG